LQVSLPVPGLLVVLGLVGVPAVREVAALRVVGLAQHLPHSLVVQVAEPLSLPARVVVPGVPQGALMAGMRLSLQLPIHR
jgi:hypothetical protein